MVNLPQQEIIPGSFSIPTLAPVYVGGVPIQDLVDALRGNQALLNVEKQTTESRFWSSPTRMETDTTREVFEVALSTAKKVNYVSFDLPRFPHRAYLFYKDTLGVWKPMLNAAKRAVTSSTVDSLPAVIPAVPPPGIHPQHFGAGHWVSNEFALNPVTAKQFRLVLVRQTGKPPVRSTTRARVPYSLGVRGFNIGFKIKERDDVPRTNRSPVVITECEPFTSSTDLLGSSVEFSVRENRASDLLKGSLWRSEPQPVANAVVNLYVDARQEDGSGQVIDRFYLDPVTTGVHMNLYYSTEVPDPTDFAAADTPLGFPLSRIGGSVTPGPDGLYFPDEVGYVDLNNATMQFNPHKPFWAGMVVQPQWGSTEAVRHVFLDNGSLRVEWKDAMLQVTLGTAVVLRNDLVFSANQRLFIVVSYDGSAISLYAHSETPSSTAGTLLSQTVSVTGAEPLPRTVRLGGLLVPEGQDPGHGLFRLLSLIVKTELPPGEEVWQEYFEDSRAYVRKADYAAQDTGTTDNAVLRYSSEFQTAGVDSINPLGFLGGSGDRYEDLVWTPVSRDFKLNKGYLVFNPTMAKFFKFEFTNLAAQPYDAFETVSRKVLVFPHPMYYPPSSKVTASGNTAGGGALVSQDATATLHYADQSRLVTNSRVAQPDGSYKPTETLFSPDPVIAARLRKASIYFNFVDWHLRKSQPRFAGTQRHIYETVSIEHTQRVGFFVALNSIRMFRVNYLADDDSEQYLELFHDFSNIAADAGGSPISGWDLAENAIATPYDMGLGEVTVESTVFNSRRRVHAIQFATQQTPAAQLLTDPDFNDADLAQWEPYGDVTITPSSEFSTDIGSLILVQRNQSANFWDTIQARYSSWDEIEESDPSPLFPDWDALQADASAAPFGGVQGVERVPVSQRGRLYAAARVYATSTLAAPLYVQIVAADGQVLSQEPVNVVGGQIAEWFTSYTMGEGGLSVSLTWDQIEAQDLVLPDTDPDHPTWDEMEDMGAWDQIDDSQQSYVGEVYARVVQTEPTLDSWYVDNISIYDDSIVWEFSNDGGTNWYPVYDIRNDPNGVFVFPDVEDEKGTKLRWRLTGTRPNQQVNALAIRPWYESLTGGMPHRESIQTSGPNQALYDHFPPIADDARWKTWHKPIPEEWWFLFRQILAQQDPLEGLSALVQAEPVDIAVYFPETFVIQI